MTKKNKIRNNLRECEIKISIMYLIEKVKTEK